MATIEKRESIQVTKNEIILALRRTGLDIPNDIKSVNIKNGISVHEFLDDTTIEFVYHSAPKKMEYIVSEYNMNTNLNV